MPVTEKRDNVRLERVLQEGRDSLDALMATIRRTRGGSIGPSTTTTATSSSSSPSPSTSCSPPAVVPLSIPRRVPPHPPQAPPSPPTPATLSPILSQTDDTLSDIGPGDFRIPSPPSPLLIPSEVTQRRGGAILSRGVPQRQSTPPTSTQSALQRRSATPPPSARNVVREVPPVLVNYRAEERHGFEDAFDFLIEIERKARRCRTPPARRGVEVAEKGLSVSSGSSGGVSGVRGERRRREVRPVKRRAKTPPARKGVRRAGVVGQAGQRQDARGGSPGSSSRTREFTPPFVATLNRSRGPRSDNNALPTLLSPSDGSKPNESSPSPVRDFHPPRIAALTHWLCEEGDQYNENFF